MEINHCKSKRGQNIGPLKRKKIWELPSNLHCSICGTCMTIKEQIDILKKLKINKNGYKDYEIHSIFANNLNQHNKLSQMVNDYLDKKYSDDIAQYGKMQECDILKVWEEKAREGDVCGFFWVAVSKADLSQGALNHIVGEVHMMSHLNGGMCRHERTQLKRLEEEKIKLRRRLHQDKDHEKRLKADLEAAQGCIGRLEKQIKELQLKSTNQSEYNIQKQSLDRLKEDNCELQYKLQEIDAERQDYRQQYRENEKEKIRLEREVSRQRETIMQLCQEIKVLTGGQACCADGALTDEGSNKGRLLMVGGSCSLNSYYREIIENMGWEFRYHDGCLNGGRQTLIERLKWSDLILCSLDVNSHGAVNCVKEYADKLKKEYRLLHNSSLSGIARVLTEQVG